MQPIGCKQVGDGVDVILSGLVDNDQFVHIPIVPNRYCRGKVGSDTQQAFSLVEHAAYVVGVVYSQAAVA